MTLNYQELTGSNPGESQPAVLAPPPGRTRPQLVLDLSRPPLPPPILLPLVSLAPPLLVLVIPDQDIRLPLLHLPPLTLLLLALAPPPPPLTTPLLLLLNPTPPPPLIPFLLFQLKTRCAFTKLLF